MGQESMDDVQPLIIILRQSPLSLYYLLSETSVVIRLRILRNYETIRSNTFLYRTTYTVSTYIKSVAIQIKHPMSSLLQCHEACSRAHFPCTSYTINVAGGQTKPTLWVNTRTDWTSGSLPGLPVYTTIIYTTKTQE